MTELLTKAFEKASNLPTDLQDQLAEELIDEMEGEGLWDQTLASTQGQLEQMARKALEEHRTGKTEESGT